MPGIAGVLNLVEGGIGPASPAQAMAASMTCEAWHTRGGASFPEARTEVGWVVESGPGQNVLRYNSRRDVVLIMVGEDFSGNVDLLDNYDTRGLEFLSQLNGRFSGLLIDLRQKTVSLFTDRFGLGRIYLYQDKDRLLFASEAKSILWQVPETRQFDEQGLAEYISCGCPLQGRTLFKDIGLLPPGTVWTVLPDGRMEKKRYFDPSSWESLPRLEPEEYLQRMETTFARIAPSYFQGQRKVGISLTGGLDSRMAVAAMGKPEAEVTTYSFSGPVRECEDVLIARKVARICGLPYQTIGIGSGFFEAFPSLAAENILVSDGCMDVSGAVELYANRAAREIASVRVTGNYGSEILRSNVVFRPKAFRHPVLDPGFSGRIQEAGATYADEFKGRLLSFIAFKQVPWFHYARLSVEQSQLTVRSPFLDNDLVQLVYQAPEALSASQESAWRIIKAGNPALARIPTDRGIVYPTGGLLNRLRRSQKEFLTKVEYAYDYGMPEGLVKLDRRLSRLRLERLILGQQKFYHFRTWYRDQLADFVGDTLLGAGKLPEGIFDAAAVTQAVEGHLKGRCNATVEIHRLLSLALIRRDLLKVPR
jgi:asparagine synthase (glutamine-hydrolysing)